MKHPKINRKILSLIVLIAVLIINFSFGFPRLIRFSAVDEPYWTYDRVPQFWQAIDQHKLKSTNINDKPGITVAWLSGIGLISADPWLYKSFRSEPKTVEILNYLHNVDFHFRLPIYIFGLLSIIAFYWLIRLLLGRTVATFSAIFIGLSPIILGMSLLVNPDGLLWIFVPLSMMSFFLFQKERQKKYLTLAGIFLGLALLTKYVANILLVYFFAMIFIDYIFRAEKKPIAVYIREEAVNYLWLIFYALMTFTILFPATWVNPKLILSGTFLSPAFKSTWPAFAALILLIAVDNYFLQSRIVGGVLDFLARQKTILVNVLGTILLLITIFVFLNTYVGMKIYNFQDILASPKSGKSLVLNPNFLTGHILADFYALIFGLTPLVLIFLIYFFFKNSGRKSENSYPFQLAFYIGFFILIYYLASSVNGVGATVRYQIIMYPLAAILAAIGLDQLLEKEKVKKYAPLPVAYVLLIFISIYSLWSVRPFYFSYASELLSSKYVLNLKDMGDGSYEAADYLNQLPNAQNLSIWSDKGAVCESFVGNCTIGFTKKDLAGKSFDYFVSSTGRQSRTFKLSGGMSQYVDFKKIYTTDQYVWQINIANRPYNVVRIVSANEIGGTSSAGSSQNNLSN